MAKKKTLYEVRPITDLRDMLHQSITWRGDHAAFLVKSKETQAYSPISYRKLGNDMDALGTELLHLGLGGKHIAIISENRYEWAVSYLSVVNGVGVVVPIDRELPPNEMEGLLRRAEVSAVLYSEKYKKVLHDMADRLPALQYLIGMDGEQPGDFPQLISEGCKKLQQGDRSYLDRPIDTEVMSVLLFTSGTTDVAKGVMLSQRNICNNLMNMCKQIRILETDIFLSVLPLHHTYECTCGFLAPLYCGSAIAYCEGLRHIQKNMAESHATLMLGVPLLFETMYKRILAQAKKSGMEKKMKTAIRINHLTKRFGLDLSQKLFASVRDAFGGSVRLFISGAAAVDPSVAAGFRDFGILFLQGYGLTECSPIVGVNRDVAYRDTSAGMLLSNMELRIEEPNEEGIGEIVVRGGNIMMGYYQNPKATAEALTDGWFHTGDLGYCDKDGFIYITGRKKSMILTANGKNVYPEELEGYLNQQPEILESVVYGADNEQKGDTEICAEIVPDFTFFEGADDQTIVDAIEAVVRRINEPLPIYKKIRKVHIRKEEFEKTTTRKIKRYKVTHHD